MNYNWHFNEDYKPTYTKNNLQRFLVARKQLVAILAAIQDRADEHTAAIFDNALDEIEDAYIFLKYYLDQNTEDKQ